MHNDLDLCLIQGVFFENRKSQYLSRCFQTPAPIHRAWYGGPWVSSATQTWSAGKTQFEFSVVILTAPVPKKYCQFMRSESIGPDLLHIYFIFSYFILCNRIKYWETTQETMHSVLYLYLFQRIFFYNRKSQDLRKNLPGFLCCSLDSPPAVHTYLARKTLSGSHYYDPKDSCYLINAGSLRELWA